MHGTRRNTIYLAMYSQNRKKHFLCKVASLLYIWSHYLNIFNWLLHNTGKTGSLKSKTNKKTMNEGQQNCEWTVTHFKHRHHLTSFRGWGETQHFAMDLPTICALPGHRLDIFSHWMCKTCQMLRGNHEKKACFFFFPLLSTFFNFLSWRFYGN